MSKGIIGFEPHTLPSGHPPHSPSDLEEHKHNSNNMHVNMNSSMNPSMSTSLNMRLSPNTMSPSSIAPSTILPSIPTDHESVQRESKFRLSVTNHHSNQSNHSNRSGNSSSTNVSSLYPKRRQESITMLEKKFMQRPDRDSLIKANIMPEPSPAPSPPPYGSRISQVSTIVDHHGIQHKQYTHGTTTLTPENMIEIHDGGHRPLSHSRPSLSQTPSASNRSETTESIPLPGASDTNDGNEKGGSSINNGKSETQSIDSKNQTLQAIPIRHKQQHLSLNSTDSNSNSNDRNSNNNSENDDNNTDRQSRRARSKNRDKSKSKSKNRGKSKKKNKGRSKSRSKSRNNKKGKLKNIKKIKSKLKIKRRNLNPNNENGTNSHGLAVAPGHYGHEFSHSRGDSLVLTDFLDRETADRLDRSLNPKMRPSKQDLVARGYVPEYTFDEPTQYRSHRRRLTLELRNILEKKLAKRPLPNNLPKQIYQVSDNLHVIKAKYDISESEEKELQMQLENMKMMHDETMEDIKERYWSMILEQKDRYKQLEAISTANESKMREKIEELESKNQELISQVAQKNLQLTEQAEEYELNVATLKTEHLQQLERHEKQLQFLTQSEESLRQSIQTQQAANEIGFNELVTRAKIIFQDISKHLDKFKHENSQNNNDNNNDDDKENSSSLGDTNEKLQAEMKEIESVLSQMKDKMSKEIEKERIVYRASSEQSERVKQRLVDEINQMEEQHHNKLQELQAEIRTLRSQKRAVEEKFNTTVRNLKREHATELAKERNIAAIMIEDMDDEKTRLAQEMNEMREEYESKLNDAKAQIQGFREVAEEAITYGNKAAQLHNHSHFSDDSGDNSGQAIQAQAQARAEAQAHHSAISSKFYKLDKFMDTQNGGDSKNDNNDRGENVENKNNMSGKPGKHGKHGISRSRDIGVRKRGSIEYKRKSGDNQKMNDDNNSDSGASVRINNERES